jgi:hypothetical protein
VDNSQSPWVAVKRSDPGIRYQHEDPGIRQNYPWQAMFACQIGILPFKEREKLKWGFTPAFLIEEATDRQKLFIESQLPANPIDGHLDTRTLALRCISTPNAGLQLGLVAKTLAASQDEAYKSASTYCRELASVFPIDYMLRPATTEDEFHAFSGGELLKKCNDINTIAQLRRFEKSLQTTQGLLRFVGLWQANIRSDEQVWRALTGCQKETLLDITIRPTTLLEGERRALLEMQGSAKLPPGEQSPAEPCLQNYKEWVDPFINRHLSPWNRYFYLQIHLAAPEGTEDYIFRSIGSSITREFPDKSSPGYQVVRPTDREALTNWRNHLDNLEMLHRDKSLLLPRLSELATLEETHAVFRLPYPPGDNLPGARFLAP